MSEALGNAQDGPVESRGPGETDQSSSTSIPVTSTEVGPAESQPDVASAPAEEKAPEDALTVASDQPAVPVGVPVALPVSMPVPTEEPASTEGATAEPEVADGQAGDQTTPDTATDTASVVSDPMEADVFDDEGYAETSTSSFVTSIASDIKKGRVENGRVYATYGNHEYGIPVDEPELDRMDLNHHKYTLLQEKLFFAPITDTPSKILDLGTGTGIWAIDIADMYPSATVIGTDIAPVQPQWVPPNCQFEIEDAESDWTFQKNTFDYIHGRDFYHMIRDWHKLVRQSYEHLKPGGFLELACIWPVPRCDDGTLPKDCAYVEVCDTFQAIGAKMQTDPDAPLHFDEYLEQAGFQNVSKTILKVPTSPWPKDPRLKKVGAMELMNLMEGAEAFLLRGYTKQYGKTKEELEMLLMEMRKELTTQRYHSYVTFVVVHGQKPPGPTASAEDL